MRMASLGSCVTTNAAAPDEVYNRPVDAEAAAFFSDHAVVVGRVESGAIDTALGRFDARGLGEGASGQVLVRPEAVEIVSAGGTGAQVTRWRLIGATGLAELELQGISLMARTPAHPGLAVGQMVQIRILAERLLVFAAGS